MDWLILLLIALGITGVLLFFYGIRNKSFLLIFFGATVLIALLFYSVNLTVFMPFAPPLALAIAYFVKKRTIAA
ncbi:hypothetical protein DHX103_11135 [Planococcus sp. X10-3]|uniref:hypothetical protein n=1 Tax=Planococcus sp. X10-3 TaxID=3061240 RepID=UPI003BAFBB26